MKSTAARVAVFTLLVSTTIALADAQSNLPRIPDKPGAAGTLQVGKTSVTLTQAYVGPQGSDETLYCVLLVDRAIPPDAIAKELQRGGGQTLLRSGKLDGVMLLVDDT